MWSSSPSVPIGMSLVPMVLPVSGHWLVFVGSQRWSDRQKSRSFDRSAVRGRFPQVGRAPSPVALPSMRGSVPEKDGRKATAAFILSQWAPVALWSPGSVVLSAPHSDGWTSPRSLLSPSRPAQNREARSVNEQ